MDQGHPTNLFLQISVVWNLLLASKEKEHIDLLFIKFLENLWETLLFLFIELLRLSNWNILEKPLNAHTNRLQKKAMIYSLETARLEMRTKFDFQKFRELIEK